MYDLPHCSDKYLPLTECVSCCSLRLNCDWIRLLGIPGLKCKLMGLFFLLLFFKKKGCYKGTEERNSRNVLTSQLRCPCSFSDGRKCVAGELRKNLFHPLSVNTASVSWGCTSTRFILTELIMLTNKSNDGLELPLWRITFSARDDALFPSSDIQLQIQCLSKVLWVFD